MEDEHSERGRSLKAWHRKGGIACAVGQSSGDGEAEKTEGYLEG